MVKYMVIRHPFLIEYIKSTRYIALIRQYIKHPVIEGDRVYVRAGKHLFKARVLNVLEVNVDNMNRVIKYSGFSNINEWLRYISNVYELPKPSRLIKSMDANTRGLKIILLRIDGEINHESN